MAMIPLRERCVRCGGTMTLDYDNRFVEVRCMLCGRSRKMDAGEEFMARQITGVRNELPSQKFTGIGGYHFKL